MLTIRLRYKAPDSDSSKELRVPLKDASQPFDKATEDLQFAAAVAAFGMLLRNSEHKGAATYDDVLAIAEERVLLLLFAFPSVVVLRGLVD